MQHRHLKLSESWIWEKEVSELVSSLIKGTSLNAPCGTSTIGDLRLDNDPEHNPNLVCDIFSFAPSMQWDTVISDPPWKVNYYHRPRWFFKIVELTKVGGRIIYNAPWIPESKFTQLDGLPYVRQSATFSNASIISVHKKLSEVPENLKVKPPSKGQ